jgi:hypothetical protein
MKSILIKDTENEASEIRSRQHDGEDQQKVGANRLPFPPLSSPSGQISAQPCRVDVHQIWSARSDATDTLHAAFAGKDTGAFMLEAANAIVRWPPTLVDEDTNHRRHSAHAPSTLRVRRAGALLIVAFTL